jgi:cation:H+ antiporter
MTGIALLAGLALLCGGAELTVRGARSFGVRVGLSPIVVGLTVVAYGTSLPELVVSTEASLAGHDGIALANVVGSNICNILLILGVCALIGPLEVHTRILRIEAPVLVAVTLGVAVLLLSNELRRAVGLVLVVALVAYTVWTVRLSRAESEHVAHAIGQAQPRPSSSVWRDLVLVLAGLAALIAGGTFFVQGASQSALALGVRPAVVGLTVVAVGTSLPELATSVLAAARGQGDIAIGNVVGSNIFNLSGVLGIAAAVDPIGPGGVSRTDLAAMLASAVVLFGFLYTGRRLSRKEGALLLGGYAFYLFTLSS